jgi:hypothetical protein
MATTAILLTQLGISEAEVQAFVASSQAMHMVPAEKLSELLVAQLAHASKHRTFDCFAVTDMIRRLEGTKNWDARLERPKKFKYKPLRGLWKVHFFEARFIARNLINEWGLQYEESPKFDQLLDRVVQEEEASPSAAGWGGRLAHELVFKGMETRKNVTGEWLVYGQHAGRNYYLCVTVHSSSPAQDQVIYNNMVALCGEEFRFLFQKEA